MRVRCPVCRRVHPGGSLIACPCGLTLRTPAQEPFAPAGRHDVTTQVELVGGDTGLGASVTGIFAEHEVLDGYETSYLRVRGEAALPPRQDGTEIALSLSVYDRRGRVIASASEANEVPAGKVWIFCLIVDLPAVRVAKVVVGVDTRVTSSSVREPY